MFFTNHFLVKSLLLLFIFTAELNAQILTIEEGQGKLTLENLNWDNKEQFQGEKLNEKLPSGQQYVFSKVVKNVSPQKRWVLNCTDKKLFNPSRMKVEVFATDSLQLLLSKHVTGYYIPQKDRDLPLWDKVNIVIHIENKNGAPLLPAFELVPQDTWMTQFKEEKSDRNLFYGLLQGLLVFVTLYNLILGLFTKDKAYVYYALTALFASVFFLYRSHLLHDYIMADYPQFIKYVWPTSLLGPVVHLLFFRSFLRMDREMPVWDYVLKIAAFLGVVLFLVEEGIMLILGNEHWVDKLNTGGFVVLILFGIVTTIYILFSKNILAYFLSFSASWLFVGSLIGVLTKNYEMIIYGFELEMLFLSLGLGYRYRQFQIEKRAAQSELIEQLRLNEELQEKVNIELAEKVKERTMDIEMQKEEILAQSRHLKEANDEIAHQHHLVKQASLKLTDSINYAQRIQSAMLPSEEQVNMGLKDSFIFFKPRDIVSGDFYWALNHQGKKFIAAVDCTGHGVPGALMSVIGYHSLNNLVNERGMIDPAQILENLDDEIRKILKQEKTENRDGMDMSLCVIDPLSKKISFAGARNGLLFFQNGEMNEFKGVKRSIGGYTKKNPLTFETITIPMVENTTYYMYSDGYQDQFGGEKNFKFTHKRLKNLLVDIQEKPMQDQCQIVSSTIDDWMKEGGESQIDDVMLLGFKV